MTLRPVRGSEIATLTIGTLLRYPMGQAIGRITSPVSPFKSPTAPPMRRMKSPAPNGTGIPTTTTESHGQVVLLSPEGKRFVYRFHAGDKFAI